MKKYLLAIVMAIVAISIFAKKNIQTVVFTTTPQMHCEACENRIKGNLRFEKGIKAIQTNVAEQTVTVRFDADKTTSEKLRQSFEKFGYKARILKKGEKVKTDTKEKCELM